MIQANHEKMGKDESNWSFYGWELAKYFNANYYYMSVHLHAYKLMNKADVIKQNLPYLLQKLTYFAIRDN